MLQVAEYENFVRKRITQLRHHLHVSEHKMSLDLGKSGSYIRERPPDSYKALAAQVAAVGNNLNQLTRLANSTGKIENAQLAEASRIMQRIWQFMQEKS